MVHANKINSNGSSWLFLDSKLTSAFWFGIPNGKLSHNYAVKLWYIQLD